MTTDTDFDPMEAKILSGELAAFTAARSFNPPVDASGAPLKRDTSRPRKPINGVRFVSEGFGKHNRLPKPTIGRVAHGPSLMYKGVDHLVAGYGGDGKTWFAMAMMVEYVMSNSEDVALFVDFEDDFELFVPRLEAIVIEYEDGTTLRLDEEGASRVGYLNPEGSLMDNCIYGRGFFDWVDKFGPDFIVIDSSTPARPAATRARMASTTRGTSRPSPRSTAVASRRCASSTSPSPRASVRRPARWVQSAR